MDPEAQVSTSLWIQAEGHTTHQKLRREKILFGKADPQPCLPQGRRMLVPHAAVAEKHAAGALGMALQRQGMAVVLRDSSAICCKISLGA